MEKEKSNHFESARKNIEKHIKIKNLQNNAYTKSMGDINSFYIENNLIPFYSFEFSYRTLDNNNILFLGLCNASSKKEALKILKNCYPFEKYKIQNDYSLVKFLNTKYNISNVQRRHTIQIGYSYPPSKLKNTYIKDNFDSLSSKLKFLSQLPHGYEKIVLLMINENYDFSIRILNKYENSRFKELNYVHEHTVPASILYSEYILKSHIPLPKSKRIS